VIPLVAASCGIQIPPYPKGLESEDPYVRGRTIQMAADRNDRAVLPMLVNRLEDEDPGVRVLAIVALERLTGERLGYNYGDPDPQRARAVKRWRAYLQGGGSSATQPAVSSRMTRRP
jgi:hypothetical protein